MRVGMDRLTLLNYPGKMAAILFFNGCNMRCPFCHNAEIAYGTDHGNYGQDIDYCLSYLYHRKGILDGVVISGGEPLLYDIEDILKRIRRMGYSIKIDTNGTNPTLLDQYIRQGLVDYIAMDVKNSPDKYAATCGLKSDVFSLDDIRDSIDLIKHSGVEYEFRTTVVDPLHTVDDIRIIGEQMIRDAEHYYLQPFVHSDMVPDSSLEEPSDELIIQIRNAVKPYVKHVAIRGRDIPAE